MRGGISGRGRWATSVTLVLAACGGRAVDSGSADIGGSTSFGGSVPATGGAPHGGGAPGSAGIAGAVGSGGAAGNGGAIGDGGIAGKGGSAGASAGAGGAMNCSTGGRGCRCTTDADCGADLKCTVELGCATVCTTDYLKFTEQTEVDAFAARHCDVVDGSIDFEGPGISSLAGLETIRVIRHVLSIGSTSLKNVDGLSGLTRVGMFVISNNAALDNIDGFRHVLAITDVGGGLVVGSQPLLRDLNALSSVSEFVGQITVTNNAVLDNLDALTAATAPTSVQIVQNPKLTSIAGLRNVKSTPTIVITGNDLLPSIDLPALRNAGSLSLVTSFGVTRIALTSLVSVDNDLTIAVDTALVELDLSRLTSVGGSLYIAGNTALTSLGDLSALTKVGALKIGGNTSLPQCEVDALDARLNACNGNCTGNDPNGTCP